MNVLILQPGQHIQLVTHEFSAPEPEYAELKTFCAEYGLDDLLERVRVRWNGEPTDMLVDEEGLLKHLPLNDIATSIYNTGHPRTSWQPIAGPALVFEKPIWF